MIGLKDPLLKHIEQTNGILNKSMNISSSSSSNEKKNENANGTIPTFGFNALTKANATVLRDYSISKNYMNTVEQTKRFETELKQSTKQPWDIDVPNNFQDLIPKLEKFHAVFGNKTFAKQREDNYQKELKLRKLYDKLGKMQINRRKRRQMLNNPGSILSKPSSRSIISSGKYVKDPFTGDKKFDVGPFQSAADNKLKLQLEAGRANRLLWRENENDSKIMEIHPDIKPGKFLRNVGGLWGSHCLDVLSKPLPLEVKEKYHAKKDNAHEMFPIAMSEVFELRGKPETSTHDLLLQQANDRVDIFGSAPSKPVQFRSDSPKSWHSKLTKRGDTKSKSRRRRPKSSPAYRSNRNKENRNNDSSSITMKMKKRRPITANTYKSTRFRNQDDDEDIELLTIDSPRNIRPNNSFSNNKTLKKTKRRPNSAATYMRKKSSSNNNNGMDRKGGRRSRRKRPETAKEKGSPRVKIL